MQLAPLDSLPAIEGELGDGDVDLWCFFYEEALRDDVLAERYAALLTSEERARHERYYFDKDKRLFLATRALVRTVLSHYTSSTAPADWRFEKNEYGKPFVAGSPFQFNLTNTRGLVACVVSHHEVGVDAENVGRKTETVEIADRFFSTTEVAALKRLPTDEHRHRFFCYWTLKESYIKARGMGLAIPLGDFSFELDAGDDIGISFAAELDDDPLRWHFRLLKASEDHTLAIGIPHPRARVRLRQYVPLEDR